MTKKTLGFIGKGGVVSHFFSYLESNFEQGRGLFDEVDKILFYNYGYETGDSFKASGSYKTITQNIGQLARTTQWNVSVDVAGSPRDITDFFSSCDVIVDAGESFIPDMEKGRRRSTRKEGLSAYAWDLFEFGKSGVNFSVESDYYFYLQELGLTKFQDYTAEGRKVTDFAKFKKNWDVSLDVLKVVSEVHRLLPIGQRMLTLFPFMVPMLLERGKQFAEVVELEQKKGKRVLPTYITIVNEPCLAGTVVTSLCPQMKEYTVGCTGYDVLRLEDCLNDIYAAEKKKAGLEGYVLRVTLRGFHDREVMIPVIYPLREEDREKFDRVFKNIDYVDAYTFMKEQVGNYFFTHTDKNMTSSQVDEALLRTIVPALQSRGRAVSVFPSYTERALCNGFYQMLGEDGGGLFLVGDSRFRNGKVWGEKSWLHYDEVRSDE